MISRLFAAAFARCRTPHDAIAHWRDVHAGLGAALPGLVRYVQYQPALDRAGHPVRIAADRGVVSLLEFADRADLDHAFAVDGVMHPALAAANDDEVNFIEPGPSAGLVGRRSTVFGDPATSAAVVVVVTGGLGERPLPDTATSHETIEATPPPMSWDVETWDVVDLVGFGSVEDAASMPDGSIMIPFTVVEREA